MKVQKIVAKVRSRNNIVLLYSVILFDSPYSKHCSKLSRVRIFEEITAKREINFFDGEFTLFFFQCPKMDTALNIFGTISQRGLCKGLYTALTRSSRSIGTSSIVLLLLLLLPRRANRYLRVVACCTPPPSASPEFHAVMCGRQAWQKVTKQFFFSFYFFFRSRGVLSFFFPPRSNDGIRC